MDSSVYHSDNTQLIWDLDSLFPYFQHSVRKYKHTYHGLHTETNSDRKGGGKIAFWVLNVALCLFVKGRVGK